MKRSLCLMLALAGSLCLAGPWARLTAASEPHQRHEFTPDTIPWGPAPAVLPPGAQFAVLEGNPMADSGDYTIRLKMPDGYKIPPHFHPLRENVSVFSGTFKIGTGDQFNTTKLSAFQEGSFAYVDPGMHHYAMACGQTVVQVHGQAPFQITYVNADDDPSKKK